jgi:hypothetical protein
MAPKIFLAAKYGGLAILAAAAILFGTLHSTPSHPALKATQSGHLQPQQSSVAATIDQDAINEAAWAGDPGVGSVTWVSTTIGAVDAATQRQLMQDTTTQVYVMELSGSFTLNVPLPRGSTAPSCDELTALLLASNFQQIGIECNYNAAPDLSILGTPETDSLAGLTAKPIGTGSTT